MPELTKEDVEAVMGFGESADVDSFFKDFEAFVKSEMEVRRYEQKFEEVAIDWLKYCMIFYIKDNADLAEKYDEQYYAKKHPRELFVFLVKERHFTPFASFVGNFFKQ